MASKRNRKKVKFKWTKELIILIASLAVLLAVTIILAVPSAEKKSLTTINDAINAYNSENSTSYSTIAGDMHLKEVTGSDEKTFENVMDIADTEGYTYFFYGSLNNGTFLENLSQINDLADKYEIESVYLVYNEFYEEAEADDEVDTISFSNLTDSYEAILNKGKHADATDIDLTIFPSFFVYKDGGLLYNTQVAKDSSEYNWGSYLNKAFSFEQIEKMNNKN